MPTSPQTKAVTSEALGLGPDSFFDARYRLDKLIGCGGMGQVWRGRDDRLDREVAIKFLHPDLSTLSTYLNRFSREMKSLAKITHPNIVRLYDFGIAPIPYMVMEYVHGVTLREMLQRSGRLDPHDAVCYAIYAADALAVAHRVPIYHRDIRPENMLINEDKILLICDFGIACDASERDRRRVDTDRVDTLSYLPPEMVIGQSVDERGDLYQLGVVLYEMLACRTPYQILDENSEQHTQAAHANGEVANLLEIVPGCPENLWSIVQRLLAKSPEARYQNATSLTQDLRAVLRSSALPASQFVRKKQSDFATAPDNPRDLQTPEPQSEATLTTSETASVPPRRSLGAPFPVARPSPRAPALSRLSWGLVTILLASSFAVAMAFVIHLWASEQRDDEAAPTSFAGAPPIPSSSAALSAAHVPSSIAGELPLPVRATSSPSASVLPKIGTAASVPASTAAPLSRTTAPRHRPQPFGGKD